MGKDQRRPVSRFKLENLPIAGQTAVKVGPLGILRKESLADEVGVRVSIGSWISFTIPIGRELCPH